MLWAVYWNKWWCDKTFYNSEMDGIFKRTWFLTEEEGGREGSHFHPQQPPDGLLLAAESTAKIGEWSLKSLGEKNECLGNSFVVSGVLTKKIHIHCIRRTVGMRKRRNPTTRGINFFLTIWHIYSFETKHHNYALPCQRLPFPCLLFDMGDMAHAKITDDIV